MKTNFSNVSYCAFTFLLISRLINHLSEFLNAKLVSVDLFMTFFSPFSIFILYDVFMWFADNKTRSLNFKSNSITSNHAFKCCL